MRVIEIFAGAGGAAMGLHAARWQTLARCEWDKDACATLRAAADGGFLDAATVIEGDVRTVDWSPYVGLVDALWASPPCQAWSSAGKRLGASDERNGWPWTWDVCDAVRPTWLLAENVTGLLMHRGDCDGSGAPEDCPACYFHRRILPEAERRFASVQWAVLNSSAFGVPQHRRRVYLVCGPRPIAWPKPTHGDPAEIRQGGLFAPALLPWRTVREALNLDAALRPERGQGMAERHGARRDHPPTEPAPQIGAGSAGSWPRLQVLYRRGRDGGACDEAHEADEPSCALRGSPGGSSQPFVVMVGIATARKPGEATASRRRTDLSDRPARTVSPVAAGGAAGGAMGIVVNGPCKGATINKERRAEFELAGLRRLTVTECALLMSWPADYPLKGTKTAQYRQVGNGCTPPVIEAIARAATKVPA